MIKMRGNQELIYGFFTNITSPYVSNAAHYQCAFCQSNKELSISHIVPRVSSPYYLLNPENCLCLCEACKNIKEVLYKKPGDIFHIQMQEYFFAVRTLLKTQDVVQYFVSIYKEIYNQNFPKDYLNIGKTSLW